MAWREWRWAALLALVAFALALVATRSGPGVSPDSVSYLAAARGLADGRGLVDYDGSPLTLWPPGFPALLGAFEAVGVAGDDAARFANAALLAVVVVLSHLLMRRHLESPRLVLFGTAVIALCPALLRTADMVWSEPLFAMLLLVFVLVLERACTSDRASALAWAGLVASGAVLVRYVGFALVASGVVAIALATRHRGWWYGLGRAAWFSGWGLVGPGLWAIRNVARSEPPLGERASGSVGVLDAARDLATGVGRLIVPRGAPDPLTIAAGLAVLVTLVAALAIGWRDSSQRRIVPVLLVVIFGIAFAFVSRIAASSEFDARILAPFVPPLAVVVLWLWQYLCRREESRAARRVALATAVLGLFGLAAFATWSVVLAYDHGRDGQQYASSAWARSEVVAATGRLPDSVSVYSNNPLPISYVNRRESVGIVHSREVSQRHPATALRDRLAREACARPIFVAWFGADAPRLGDRVRSLEDGSLIAVECDARA